MSTEDRVARAMTSDGSLRLIVATIADVATTIASAQKASPVVARRMAEVALAAILVRETSAPHKRVQVTLNEADGSSLMAESHPDGACRGFLNPVGDGVETSDHGLLQVAYHRRDGSLHQSTIAMDATASVADALMQYLQTSEQIVATVEVRATGSADDLHAAAFAVQLLPQAHADVVETMTAHLEERDPLDTTASVAALLSDLAGELDLTPLADSELRFECSCSRERVLVTLAGLTRDDIVQIIDGGEAAEVHCDGCDTVYRIELAELSGMLAATGDGDN